MTCKWWQNKPCSPSMSIATRPAPLLAVLPCFGRFVPSSFIQATDWEARALEARNAAS